MTREFTARFSLEDKNNQKATFTLQTNKVNASFAMTSRDHETLFNRDKANQHPISAITDLEDRLEALENQDKNFVFEQAIASATWVIEHDLNKYPSVSVVDSAGTMQIPDEIKYDSENQITITFISAFAGKAILN